MVVSSFLDEVERVLILRSSERSTQRHSRDRMTRTQACAWNGY